MTQNGVSTLPPGFSAETLQQLLQDTTSREAILAAKIQHFEQHYETSLEALEDRLERGEGNEHPDWEDSIEWRTAVEILNRTQRMRSLLEWLLDFNEPSPIS